MGRKPTRARPRAAWFPSEIAPALTADVRRRLGAANKGHVVAPADVATLDRAIGEVLYLRKLAVGAADARAQVASLQKAAVAIKTEIRKLHPRVRTEVLTSLALGWGKPSDLGDLSRIARALELACMATLREMPAKGGRPREGHRDAVVATVAAFVDNLRPTRARAITRRALSRAADPDIDLGMRRRESVKLVLRALKLPVPVDLDAIIARRLPE